MDLETMQPGGAGEKKGIGPGTLSGNRRPDSRRWLYGTGAKD
jgi:hypothetical protein